MILSHAQIWQKQQLKNCLPPTLPMYTISEVYYHTLFTVPGSASTGGCHFLLKQPEIYSNLITNGLFFSLEQILQSTISDNLLLSALVVGYEIIRINPVSVSQMKCPLHYLPTAFVHMANPQLCLPIEFQESFS